MASKSFRVAVATEKIQFDLEYLDKSGRGVTHTFHCRPTISTEFILKFATSMDNESKESGIKAISLIQELFEMAIVPEEYGDFLLLLEDPDIGIDINMYTEIASWLAEQYTAGRPTGESSASTQPASSRGTDSTDGASPVALTYSRPEPVAATR